MLNVLLIDDEKSVQVIMSSFLQRYAQKHDKLIKNIALLDPVKGLYEATTNGNHYDLILLDVHLPGISGDEIYQNIMQKHPELLDRVLFVTGYREDLDERFPDLDLNVLDKPFRYAQLEERIHAILS
jgi:DNA-binding response OmpR family regulator